MKGNKELSNVVNLEERVKQWWSDLQRERKCSGTCVISKTVNKISEEEQEKVRQLIASLIKEGISSKIESKDIPAICSLCSAINGCFDNFVHAADAANIAFDDIIAFIHFCIEECSNRLFIEETAKCNVVQVLDLLHCLSRILVLILKLRRPLKSEKKSEHVDNGTKILLAKLSYKISSFLKVDEILMDTKCNFVMGSLLIREIIMGSREKLLEYHEKFVMMLPAKLEKDELQLNMYKFLLSNAVLNTWSNIVIDGNSAKLYLKFFVLLCESYSRETAIILNVSRALLLLVQNECFKDCVVKLTDDEINSLLSCVWMLVDHPVACIRHSAKDFLQILAHYEKFKSAMFEALTSLPNDKRSYFITLAALANESGSRRLMESYPELSQNLLLALNDPTLVTYVIYALESLILKDPLVNESFSSWCETWILPLLVSLSNVALIVAADIEKLLDGLFKRYPQAIFCVINKWSEPKNDEELRYIITALKIYNRHGFKLNSIEGKDGVNVMSSSEKWKDLISEKLLRFCLHHNDDDIRVSAFSLIIQGLKSTEVYTEQDFNLIRHFFVYNLNNQQPATRQKILSLIKKMLARFADSLTVVKRTRKNSDTGDVDNYRKFKDWLVDFCFSNIFDGANFNRLNTVLCTLLCVIEYTGNVDVTEGIAAVYLRKILVALKSSYEENKAMAVMLSTKLNIHNLLGDSLEMVRLLFRKGYDLCGKMEPPNVLTGSYLIQILIEFPSFREVSVEYLEVRSMLDSKSTCLGILSDLLGNQVENAEDNLIKAAANGPMYGTLFAIRLIMRMVNFSDSEMWTFGNIRFLWTVYINTLIDLSFRMIAVVSCVVNSSSPEGHLPSDFQYDFELTLNEDLTALRERSTQDERSGLESLNQGVQDLRICDSERLLEECDCVIRRFNRVFLAVNNSSSFSQEMAVEFSTLLGRCSRLINDLERESSNTKISDYSNCLVSIKEKLEKCLKIYKRNSLRFGKPTAQVLLLCAWRSIKEACLFLGDFMSKLSLDRVFELNLILEERAVEIGEQLRTLLCEIKHRGAFEQAYVGFGQVMNAFWRCSRKSLSELPMKWLQEILEEIKLPLEEQKMKFCSSRRSAGLPFLVQAIISSELQCVNSAKIQTLDLTMNALLDLVEKDDDSVNLECKIHSLNILRALFKHAMLGEHVAPYVSRALMVSIRGSRADAWSIRNSSSLLFSSLVIRIFGVARNKDALSKKNKMTSKIFFQRYPELYEFFLSEMRLGCPRESKANEYHPQPNVFHVLLILGRLYPPPTEDSMNMDFSGFLPLIDTSCHSPTLKIRELGARALVPLISPENLRDELEMRFSLLHPGKIVDGNQRHGVLLQVKTILSEVSHEHVKKSLEDSGSLWIENTEWLLHDTEKCHTPYLIKIVYAQILHVIYRTCHSLRENVKNAVNRSGDGGSTGCLNIPGYFAYKETLSFLKFDIASNDYYESGDGSQMAELFLALLKSDVEEVKAIPLRFLNFAASENQEESIEEDDVNSVTSRIRDLICVRNEKCFEAVKREILTQSSILHHIVEYMKSFLTNAEGSANSPHKVTTRLWMSVIRVLLLKDIVKTDDFHEKGELFDSLLYLVDCGDSDIAVSAFVCYSVLSFDKIARGKASSESIPNFVKILFNFSDPDADVKQRLAVAEIFNKYYWVLDSDLFKTDNQLLSILSLPVRLMADDEPSVRKSIARLVPKCQKYLSENREKFIIPLEDGSVSELTTVPPKAQEYLLDCYVNLMGEENLFHLTVQMVLWSLAAYVNTVNCDHMTKQNEAGVFEKGNPNPFCEEFAFANLIFRKLEQLKTLADVTGLFERKLNETHVRSLRDFLPTLTLPQNPQTLSELIRHIVYILTENIVESEIDTMSLLSEYVKNLKKALCV